MERGLSGTTVRSPRHVAPSGSVARRNRRGGRSRSAGDRGGGRRDIGRSIGFASGRTSRTRSYARLVLGLVVLAGLIAAAGVMQVGRALPKLSLRYSLPATAVVPGAAPLMPWPAVGEAAVAVPALGVSLSSPGSHAVPIASVTKMMTAYIVLRDHPLAVGAQGPSVTMTSGDVGVYSNDVALDESSVPVNAGASLTERQLLEALLIPSANNIANLLAIWDAGTTAAFVAKMNATARELGMTATQYAGPSGYNPGSVSTPADQIVLAEKAMEIPAFAAIVDKPTVNLPVAGVVGNYNVMLGHDGVVGVKSGFTAQADGCLVVAATSNIQGTKGLVYAAVFGQLGMDPLGAAGSGTRALVDAARSGFTHYRVVVGGDHAGDVQGRWGGRTHTAGVVLKSSASVVAWPGEVVRLSETHRNLIPGQMRGTTLGDVIVQLGTQRLTVPLLSQSRLPKPSLTWRLTRL